MMSENTVDGIFEASPLGLAYHEMIYDENNRPVDYRFLNVNQAFEQITGLSVEGITGRCAREVIPDFENSALGRIAFYGRISLDGCNDSYEYFSESQKRWYKVEVYSTYKPYFTTMFTDITSYKLVKEEPEEIKDRYETLVNNIPGITYRCKNDADWTMIFISPGVDIVSGYCSSELLFNAEISYAQLIHSEDRQKVSKAISAAIDKKIPWEVEYRIRHKNGNIRWAYERGRGIFDDRGRLLYLDGVILDITDKVQRDQHFEGFFSINLDLLCIADQDGNFIKVNKEWEKVLGYTVEELEKKKFLEFVHPDDIPSTVDVMAQLEDNEKVLNFVNRYRCKDGSYRSIEWRSHPSGGLIYAAARDITERLKETEEIRRRESETSAVLGSMNDLVLVLDRELVFRKVYNPDFMHLLFDSEFLINKSFDDIGFPEPAYSKLRKALGECIESGANTSVRYYLDMPQGKAWYDAKISHFKDEKGAPAGLTCVVRDITQNISKELELANEKKLTDKFFNQSLYGFFFSMIEEPIDWNESTDKDALLEYVLDHQHITRVNQAMLDQYGADEQDFIGISIRELFKHNLDHAREILRGLFDKGHWHVETHERKLDGNPMIIDGDYVCLNDDQGRITGHFGVQTEITERRHVEQALKDTLARYDELVALVPVGIYVYWIRANGKHEFEFVSDRWCEMVQLQRKDVLADAMLAINLIHKDEREDFMALNRESAENLQPFTWEGRAVIAQNDMRWVRIESNPVATGNGDIHWFGMMQDITKRKIAEAALVQREQELQNLVNTQTSYVVRTDMYGRHIYWNRKFEEDFGWIFTEGGIFNGNSLDSICDYHHDRTLKTVEKCMTNPGTIVKVELDKPAKNGGIVTTLWEFVTLADQNKNTVAIQCMGIDITEKREAELALIESEEKFRQISESIEEVFWLRSADNAKMFYVSPAYEKVWGRTRQSLYDDPQSFIDSAYDQDKEPLLAEFAKYQKSGYFDHTYRIVRPDGEIRWVRAQSFPVKNEHGEVVRHTGMAVDITKQKMLEEQLRELNATKDKFFSIIAHDLRSPFNSIIGFSELLADQIKSKDYDGIDQYAEIIRKSSHLAMDLLTNLLEWSRMQTGRMAFKPESIDLGDLISGALNLLENNAVQKSITIKVDTPPGLMVFADPPMINTVLRNLISNAVKFTNHGGEIIVSVEKAPEEVIVSVKDNGVGISPHRIDKLFSIDTTESTTGTNNEQGTGLGLILCKEFIEKHGGKIWVKSIVDKGTAFTFSIPEKKFDDR